MHILFHLEKLNFRSTFITRIAEFLIFQFKAAAHVDGVVISDKRNTLLLLLPLQVAPFVAAVVDLLLLAGVRCHHSKLLYALSAQLLLLLFFRGVTVVLLLFFVAGTTRVLRKFKAENISICESSD